MTIFQAIVLLFIILFIIFVTNWLTIKASKSHQPEPQKIPDNLPKTTKEDNDLLNLYLKEWEIIINTQMHFNDLIIRFRTIIITAFVTLVGASLTLYKAGIYLSNSNNLCVVLFAIGVLWGTAFLIDYCYYHRLLLGAVKQANKYDKSLLAEKYGLFGMTDLVSKHISHEDSSLLVFLFYFLPGIMLLIVSVWIK